MVHADPVNIVLSIITYRKSTVTVNNMFSGDALQNADW